MERPTRLTQTLVMLITAALSGCGAGSATSSDPFGGPAAEPRSAEIRIVTDNRYISEVTLYAVSGGRRVRMGSLGGLSDRSFSVPWPTQSNLQVEIQTLDGSRYLTPAIFAAPGETVELTVESQLRYSRLRH